VADDPPPLAVARPTKTCPDCAETILEAARVCRHCGFRFEPIG
jgi:predicted amidophosphoribosyltransferase